MIQSKLLSNIPCVDYFFGTAAVPTPLSPHFHWKHLPQWEQVHGTDIQEVSKETQNCGKVDGLVTSLTGIPIGVYTADCVPILLARKDGSRVAALHAGWRGTEKKIVRQFFDFIQKCSSESPSNWVSVIGPSISAHHYTVSKELIQKFKRSFPSYSPDDFLLGGNRLDLQRLNELELIDLGVDNTEIIPLCTFQESSPSGYVFNSYRREKTPKRQFTAIIKCDT